MNIDRIKYYESLLNEGNNIIDNLNKARLELLKFYDKYKMLSSYFDSEERKEDVLLDMNNKLPKDLNRGVLAEDYLYDFLNEYEYLLAEIDDKK